MEQVYLFVISVTGTLLVRIRNQQTLGILLWSSHNVATVRFREIENGFF